MTTHNLPSWQPKIAAFVCNWCTYAGADLAGTTRMEYKPNVRIIRLPCTGRIDPLFLIRAFENGADGIIVSGCHPGDCHYVSGNLHARRRWIFFKSLLSFTGMDERRVTFSWISASEALKWAGLVDEVTERIRSMGPFVEYQRLKGFSHQENGPSVWSALGGEAWAPEIPKDVPLPGEQPIEKDLRVKARKLLASGEVRVVIGYGWARRQRRTVPIFVTDPGEVDQLIFNPLCVNNLSLYLLKKYKDIQALGRPAIVAKGCDIRTIVVLLKEAQIAREDVVILGMPCNGMVYRQELWRGELASEILSPKCETCDVKNPHLYDHLIGEKLNVPASKETRVLGEGRLELTIKELDGKSPKDRWSFWMEHFERCIKCYACRQVCPLCYCERCITEKNIPQWVETSAHPRGNLCWNLVRAIHLAGRCTSCGECDRVCPANIPLNLINRKLALVGEEAFSYRSGYDPEAHPPMIVYNPNDQENFIR